MAEQVWNFLERPQSSAGALTYDFLMPVFIVATIIVSLGQTFDRPLLHGGSAVMIESTIDVVFSLEVILRIYACPNHIAFFFNPHNIIDLLAAAPLTLRVARKFEPLAAEGEYNLQRVLLLGFVPVLRLLKTLRRFRKFHLLAKAFELAFEALPVLLYIYLVLWLSFTALIYACEPRENVGSLPRAMWMTVMSMTTVGYGDLYPVTTYGRLTVAVLVVVSALYVAIPLGILGSCFSEVWRDRDRVLLVQGLRTSLVQSGFKAHDIPTLFDSFDKDGDGSLNFKEFREMVEKLKLGFPEERLFDLFVHFDHDENGCIAQQEFVKFMFPRAYFEYWDKDVNRLRSIRIVKSPSACDPSALWRILGSSARLG